MAALSLGIVNAKADTNNSENANGIATNAELSQEQSTNNTDSTTSHAISPVSQTNQHSEQDTSNTVSTENTQTTPVTNPNPSSSDHPADWNNNYERIIVISYYPQYTISGGTNGELTQQRFIQTAVDGHWDAFDWTPPEGTFPAGVKVPTVHFTANDNVTNPANQYCYVTFLLRTIFVQANDGLKTFANAYTITNNQTLSIPEMEVSGNLFGIPIGYLPTAKYANLDQVVYRNGHYYLTGATVTADQNGTVTYYGAKNKQPDLAALSEKVTFTAPINYVFKDLDDKVYNAYGDEYPDYAAIFKKVQSLDYPETLSNTQLVAAAQQYLSKYVSDTYGAPDDNYQVYGILSSDGNLYSLNDVSMDDAVATNQNGLTFNFVVVYRLHSKYQDPIVKTRTIILHKPTGDEIVKQTITFQQFVENDGITGKWLSEPEMMVLTGTDPGQTSSWSSLTDDNHSWDNYQIPKIDNYTSNQTTVDAQAVDTNTPDQVINIYYTANTTTVSESKNVTRTIRLIAPNGQETMIPQIVTFTRSGVKNLATGETTWGDWQTVDNTWPVFTAPHYNDYLPSIERVASQQVTSETDDQEVTITYYQIPVTPSHPEHDSSQTSINSKHNSSGPVFTSSTSSSKQTTNHQNHQQQLPQTGNQPALSLITMGSLIMINMLGLTGFRKKNNG